MTQHNNVSALMLSVVTHFIYCYAECRCSDYRHAECHSAECRYTNCRRAIFEVNSHCRLSDNSVI
jgi:hypothetical protein